MGTRFGEFLLDSGTRQVLRGVDPLHLSPKAFELLTMLVSRRPAAVSKSDIHQHLWPGSFVSDGNVAVLITDIRRALGDDAARPVFIRTIHRFGYAFVADAAEHDRSVIGPSRVAACWLTREDKRASINAGENIVGRGLTATIRIGLDPGADLSGDPVGVSRRHAMIVVRDNTAMLHDLSSKNGTVVDGEPITVAVPLVHGATIQLGTVSVRFEQFSDASATGTLDPSNGRAAAGSEESV